MFFNRSLLVFALFVAACSSDEDQIQEDRLIRMLDEQEYAEVVNILDDHVRDDPQSRYSVYLAQAYLGLARFEPLDFAVRVLAPQKKDHPTLDRIFSYCDRGPLNGFSRVPEKCIVYRLFRQLPASDNAHFRRAREILRVRYDLWDEDTKRYLPQPLRTPPKYNLLLGMVDAAAAISRFGELIVFFEESDIARWNEKQVNRFFFGAQQVALDAQATLMRAENSPNISRFLTGLHPQVTSLFRSDQFEFVMNTGIPTVVNYINANDGKTLEGQILRAGIGLEFGNIIDVLADEKAQF